MLPKVRVYRYYKFPIVREKPIMSYLSFVYLPSVLKLIPNFTEFFILSLALLRLLDQIRGSYYITNICSITILTKLHIKLPKSWHIISSFPELYLWLSLDSFDWSICEDICLTGVILEIKHVVLHILNPPSLSQIEVSLGKQVLETLVISVQFKSRTIKVELPNY